MLRIVALSTSLAMACSGAVAATSIVQDRDNEIRNYYQKTASASCNAKASCVFSYPAVPKGQMLLVNYIACLIVNSAPIGVTVKLYPAKTPTMFIPFYEQGTGNSINNNQYISVNTVTRLYVNAGDAPAISLAGTSAFIGTSTCFISGETVLLP